MLFLKSSIEVRIQGLIAEIEAYKGLFTPWIIKSSQGPIKYVMGC
jgi:hypothetical protein